MNEQKKNDEEDLINRYVYAVVKNLPHKNRTEIEKEIRLLIDDTVESFLPQSSNKKEAVKLALVKIGTPEELAAKYSGDGETSLISGTYYLRYKQLLKIVMSAVLGGMIAAEILSGVTNPHNVWYVTLCTAVGAIFNVECCAFAFITITFAVAQRKHVRIENSGTGIDSLPPVPAYRISRVQCVCSISFITLFFILFMTAPQFFRMPDSNGKFVSVLNSEYIRQRWIFLALFCLCGIVRDSVKLFDLRYTKRLLITTAVTNVGAAASAGLFFSGNGTIMSETYRTFMSAQLYQNEYIRTMMVNFGNFFLIVILFALVLDTVETAVKYGKETTHLN